MNSAPEGFSGRSVLVTGASGFIGRSLVERLLGLNSRVHVLLRPESDAWRLRQLIERTRVHHGDIADMRAFSTAIEEAAPEVIFHLATERGNDQQAWSRLCATSLTAALCLVETLRNTPSTRLVVAGSAFEYGLSEFPHKESDRLSPTTWHGVGKAAASLVYHQASRAMGLDITQLRLFHVYGPWESSHRLLPVAIRAAITGEPLPLTYPGIRRDWVYVDDVVDALLLAACSEVRGQTFNIGSGVDTSNEALVDMVEALVGKPVKRLPGAFLPSVSDTGHRCADVGEAKRVLGWVPATDLRSGVAASVGWFRRYPDLRQSASDVRPAHV